MLKRLTILALVLLLAGCGGNSGGGDSGGGEGDSGSGGEPLRVGLIPNENPKEVEAQYQPLEDYLKEELGREVAFGPDDLQRRGRGDGLREVGSRLLRRLDLRSGAATGGRSSALHRGQSSHRDHEVSLRHHRTCG